MTADTLPCGHPLDGSLFATSGGTHVLIAHGPVETGFGGLPATVWCADGCGWLKVTEADYAVLKEVGR